jgi:hypothetical protein
VLEGTAAATPLEAALVGLVRTAHASAARLAPAHLDPVRALVGDGALEYALVLGTFHFINRMADLLRVDAELPLMPWLRRVEPVRRRLVRLLAVPMRRMDLAVRPYARTFDQATAALPEGVDRAALAPLRPRPHLVEALAAACEERAASSLPPETRARVDAVVESALPASADDVDGFHDRPRDPVDAFAFVGTRYARRTTAGMIEALRARGYDDLGLLDLAIAVAGANEWARLRRLLGVPALPGRLSPG